MILEQFKLDGKVAIVTGAGRGIGQAYALGLAEAGADIAIVDVIPMGETIAAVKKLGRRAIGIKADLAKGEKESPKIVAKVVKQLGSVDILVNNAGIIRR
ncbi:MAG: SDR family NAD(P)-dependent oxidoreductase, partial [Sphingobacteriia bacterium]|nr:SDR family NAD(P)-dependent oxidoreductase [Sphingobacteriia bacterium]